MKHVLVLTLFSGIMLAYSCLSTHGQNRSSVLGIFVASTPCGEGVRPVPGMDTAVQCEFMKWKLVLYYDSNANTPDHYTLACTYGLSLPSTPRFIGGGTTLNREGKWTIATGIKNNPGAVVYQLDPDKPGESISFWKMNDALLHLLDAEKGLMIGNAAWSYTLNKLPANQ